MDFSLTEEQQEVQDLAQRILGDQVTNESLRGQDAGGYYDEARWRELAEAGLLGIAIPEAHGGMGFGFETLCLLVEQVGATVAPVPVIPALVGAGMVVSRFGGAGPRDQWLPGLADGSHLLSVATVDAQSAPVGWVDCRAEVSASGGWQLTGTKYCVPHADRAVRVVLAARGPEGVQLFLVDPRASGVSLAPGRSTAGEAQWQMALEEAPAEELVAAAQGEEAWRWLLERLQAAWCMMAVGVAEKAMRMTAQYTSERKQFGVPIATFQAVGQRAADCYIDVQCLRLVTQQAVALLEQEKPATLQVQVAKIWAGEVTHRVSQAAQHLHGGAGVDRDYPLFRYCLWCKQAELSLGNSSQLRNELGKVLAQHYLAA